MFWIKVEIKSLCRLLLRKGASFYLKAKQSIHSFEGLQFVSCYNCNCITVTVTVIIIITKSMFRENCTWISLNCARFYSSICFKDGFIQQPFVRILIFSELLPSAFFLNINISIIILFIIYNKFVYNKWSNSACVHFYKIRAANSKDLLLYFYNISPA